MLIRLKEWRQVRGLSMRRLADCAGIGFASVYRIESGRISPTIAMLEKLAAALEIRVIDFIPGTAKPPSKRRTTT
jgi:transcriptional regulator with XRE-family HTH domain